MTDDELSDSLSRFLTEETKRIRKLRHTLSDDMQPKKPSSVPKAFLDAFDNPDDLRPDRSTT